MQEEVQSASAERDSIISGSLQKESIKREEISGFVLRNAMGEPHRERYEDYDFFLSFSDVDYNRPSKLVSIRMKYDKVDSYIKTYDAQNSTRLIDLGYSGDSKYPITFTTIYRTHSKGMVDTLVSKLEEIDFFSLDPDKYGFPHTGQIKGLTVYVKDRGSNYLNSWNKGSREENLIKYIRDTLLK